MKLDSWEQLEPILLDFEASWREGKVPAIHDFVPRTGANRLELISELVMIDFEHRLRQKSTTNIDRYFRDWPELDHDLETRRALLAHEFELRRKFGEFPSQAEIESRFGNDPTVAELHSSAQGKSTRARTLHEPQFDDGTRVNSYVIERRIGRGAFSTVYAAMHSRLQRRTALKFLSQASDLKPEMRQRMLREAQAVASLEHPNIVPVFETGHFQGHDYIASRFVDGETLAERLEANRPTIDTSVRIVSQLASALAASHRAGVVHRDIKPANIMLEGNTPLLLDFGLAHLGDATLQLTHEGDMLGTPAYMSPEQADGRAFQGDPRSDVYSLGVVLFQMICGRLPFEGSTAQVISQVLHNEPTRPRELNAEVTHDLQTIVLKCLQKDPLDRFQTAEELQADLDRLTRGEPIHARPVGLATKSLKWARRRPLVAGLLATVMALGVFLAGAATQVWKVAEQRDVAEGAKREAERLLADSAASAGLLAMQRGQMTSAIGHFNQALDNGHPDRSEMMLHIVECNIVNRDLDDAVSWLRKAEAEPTATEHGTQLAVWKAELAFEGFDEFGDTLTEFERLRHLPNLREDDGHYVDGVLAATSPEAVDAFRLATEANPFHHRARRMLIFMLVSLGRFDEASSQCEIAGQLYPDDDDFRLLEALTVAAKGHTSRATQLLEAVPLGDEKHDWLSLTELLDDVVNDNEKFVQGRDQLDIRKLTGALIGLRSGELRTVLDRKWRLPPRITASFTSVAESLPKLQFELTIGIGKGQNDALAQLAEVHPESSILIMHATHCLSQVPDAPKNHELEIGFLKAARAAHEQALQNPGFINNRLLCHKGIFIASLLLADRYQQDAETNHQRMLEALRKIETNGTPDTHARVYTIMAIRHGDMSETDRWTRHWLSVTTENSDDQHNARWHRMVYFQKLERWLDVRELCQLMLKQKPDHQGTQGALRQAVAKLKAAVEPDDQSDPAP